MDRQASWLLGFGAFDRFIRTVAMFSAVFFGLVSVLVFFKTGTLGIAKQNALYILYGFACSSALYFVEAKPPSAKLAWEDAAESRQHGQIRF
jgi:hypothetical protein